MGYVQNQELYKVSVSTGKMQVWSGCTVGAEIHTTFGQLGGKMQTQITVATPKNVGRSNETTAEEQANLELMADYKAQVDNKHYRTTKDLAREFAESNREPRKILDYKKGFCKMSDTLYSSKKFNGSRACVLNGDYLSKIGKVEEIKVEHLKSAIDKLQIATGGVYFDAEVYAHGLSLQRIRSAFLKPVKTEKEIIKIAKDRLKSRGKVEESKKMKFIEQAIDYLGYNPNEDAGKLKLYVFDIPVLGVPFVDRLEKMRTLEDVVVSSGLEDVIKFEYPVITCCHEERMEMLEEVVNQGYEGYVHYEVEGMYEFGRRSTNAQKSKPRYDSEARVVGVIKDKRGNGTLECIACDTLDNIPFKCVMKVDRRDGTSHPDKSYETCLEMVGKWITFSYEELSDKGVPTKPVGEIERECDSEGNPLN
ncbi:nucleic acid-binding, OB-fold protein [Vibrio phage 1.121.O._10N.286.46.C4]|nr:nucleic acid-binding, OB-fold protein [Vibrio phage 1.121.O._10N.286.46.C4]